MKKIPSKLDKTPKAGGYRPRQPKRVLNVTKAMKAPARRHVPVPPGIREVLLAKFELKKEISRYFTGYFNVSINVKDNKWILEVRGWEYPLDYFRDYEVVYIHSTMVRNPKSRML